MQWWFSIWLVKPPFARHAALVKVGSQPPLDRAQHFRTKAHHHRHSRPKPAIGQVVGRYVAASPKRTLEQVRSILNSSRSAMRDFADLGCAHINVCFFNSNLFSSGVGCNMLVPRKFNGNGPVKSFTAYVSMFALCLGVVSSPSVADERRIQDCNAESYDTGVNYTQGPDCLLSWIDNNRLQTVAWSQVEEDFQEASLVQDSAALSVLTSSYWPGLVDVDQDGWLDMITFERVGSLNGPFVIFFYDPVTKQFNQAEPIYGHTLERDMLGYIVVTGSSGAGWEYQFYTLANRELTFFLDVEPIGRGQSGGQFGEYCDVSLGFKQPLQFDIVIASGQIPDAEAFFASYCDLEPDLAASDRTEPLREVRGATDRVPTDTVLYCVLDGGTKAVTITQASHSMFYSYGPVGGEAELELVRPHNLVPIRPNIADDGARSSDVTFTNGAYEYIVFRNDERSVEDDTSTSADALNGGLVVYKDGDRTTPIFERSCIPERSIDLIFP